MLVYRGTDYGNAIVIALEADARRVDAINKAIKTAETWGEFRAMLPAGEWVTIVEYLDPDELVTSFADDHPFDNERLPGYSEREYPVWLMQRMLDILPEDILEKYADISAGMMTSGNVCYIEEDSLEDICRELEERGFIMQDGSYLDYF